MIDDEYDHAVTVHGALQAALDREAAITAWRAGVTRAAHAGTAARPTPAPAHHGGKEAGAYRHTGEGEQASMSDDGGAYWDGFKMGCTTAVMLLALMLAVVATAVSLLVAR